MFQNINNIAQKCKSYDKQKILIAGLLITNRFAQDFMDEVNKFIENTCYWNISLAKNYCITIHMHKTISYIYSFLRYSRI